MRVLVVDDSRDSLLIMSRMLPRFGHIVATAEDGAEALKQSADFQPEVVFLDLWMPHMDGYQVAAQLRKLPGLKSVRIVAMSGADPDAELAKMAGIDAYLLKPASLHQMLEAMGCAQTA